MTWRQSAAPQHLMSARRALRMRIRGSYGTAGEEFLNPSYIHTYIRTYIHTYIHTYVIYYKHCRNSLLLNCKNVVVIILTICCCSWTSDSKHVITASRDGTCKIWRISSDLGMYVWLHFCTIHVAPLHNTVLCYQCLTVSILPFK